MANKIYSFLGFKKYEEKITKVEVNMLERVVFLGCNKKRIKD